MLIVMSFVRVDRCSAGPDDAEASTATNEQHPRLNAPASGSDSIHTSQSPKLSQGKHFAQFRTDETSSAINFQRPKFMRAATVRDLNVRQENAFQRLASGLVSRTQKSEEVPSERRFVHFPTDEAVSVINAPRHTQSASVDERLQRAANVLASGVQTDVLANGMEKNGELPTEGSEERKMATQQRMVRTDADEASDLPLSIPPSWEEYYERNGVRNSPWTKIGRNFTVTST